jgi:hypothetical protein
MGMNQFIKNLPIYINGFTVAWIFFEIPVRGPLHWTMFVLAVISFFWHGKNEKGEGES